MNPQEIAKQDARRIALVMRELDTGGERLDGGWMGFDEEGSWARYASGIGDDGPVSAEVIDRLVAFYKERGRKPRIQLHPYVHESLVRRLGERGFVVEEIETVLGHDLTGDLEGETDLTFKKVDPRCEEDVTAFVSSQLSSFHPGGDAPQGLVAITQRVACSPRSHIYLVEQAGSIVGSGGLEGHMEYQVLIAGCVRAENRRQGVHQSLVLFRLQEARRRGARFVLISSLAGQATERNALRLGFRPLWTCLNLVLR